MMFVFGGLGLLARSGGRDVNTDGIEAEDGFNLLAEDDGLILMEN